MSAPANARPIASTRNNVNTEQSMSVARHTPSAAIAQTAAVVSAGKPATKFTRPAMQSQQQPRIPRVSRAMPPKRGMSNPNTARMWQRMNVAMNGGEWTGESEDLPLPGPTTTHVDSSDPFGSDPDGYYLHGDEQYPGCGPDGCGDGCGGACGDACACGDGCEPGCACGCGDDPACNDCLSIGPGDPESCHSVRVRVPKWQELQIFGGVQGFKGPYDKDRDGGNFGFH